MLDSENLDVFPATALRYLAELLRDREFQRGFPDSKLPDVDYFSGEFFDPDAIENLMGRVTSRPVLLVDYDDLFPVSETTISTKGTNSFTVYCCTNNRRSEADQMIYALTVAARVRRWIVGKEFQAESDSGGVHNNGFFTDEGIHRQVQLPGLSAYSFDTNLDITEQTE